MNRFTQFQNAFEFEVQVPESVKTPIRFIPFNDLAVLYDLEDWLQEMSPANPVKPDADFVLATSSMREVFYLALVSVIKQHGVNYKDRFFHNGKLLSLSELKGRTLSGQRKPKHCLDSLWDLVQFAYRRCVSQFKKELAACVNNKQCFYYYRKILDIIYNTICIGLGDRLVDQLHTKAVLTSLMKKDIVERLQTRC